MVVGTEKTELTAIIDSLDLPSGGSDALVADEARRSSGTIGTPTPAFMMRLASRSTSLMTQLIAIAATAPEHIKTDRS